MLRFLIVLASKKSIRIGALATISLLFYYKTIHDIQVIENEVGINADLETSHVVISSGNFIQEEEEEGEESCFRPRPNNLEVISKPSLPTPFINLGMPKMGSTSLHSYFRCGNYTSVHWICSGDTTNGTFCGDCIEESIKAGLQPLSKCPSVDSYAQIDRGPENMVQVNHLDEIVSGIPNATFIMTFRNMTKWYMSMSRWLGIAGTDKSNNMRVRFQKADIKGLPPGVGRNLSEFSKFYCDYVRRVRSTIAKYPGHELIEVDIEDPTAGLRMEEAFGVSHACWAKTNIQVHNDAVSLDELHRRDQDMCDSCRLI